MYLCIKEHVCVYIKWSTTGVGVFVVCSSEAAAMAIRLCVILFSWSSSGARSTPSGWRRQSANWPSCSKPMTSCKTAHAAGAYCNALMHACRYVHVTQILCGWWDSFIAHRLVVLTGAVNVSLIKVLLVQTSRPTQLSYSQPASLFLKWINGRETKCLCCPSWRFCQENCMYLVCDVVCLLWTYNMFLTGEPY